MKIPLDNGDQVVSAVNIRDYIIVITLYGRIYKCVFISNTGDYRIEVM